MQAVVQVFPGNLRAKFGQPLANHNAVMALSLETGVLLLPGIRVDCQGAKPRRKSCWNKRFIETCKFEDQPMVRLNLEGLQTELADFCGFLVAHAPCSEEDVGFTKSCTNGPTIEHTHTSQGNYAGTTKFLAKANGKNMS